MHILWLIMTTQTLYYIPLLTLRPCCSAISASRLSTAACASSSFFPWVDWLLSIGPDGLFVMCNYTSPTLASNLASCKRRHTRRCPVIGSTHVKLPELGSSCLLECRATFGDDGRVGFHLFDVHAAARSSGHSVHEQQHFESPSAAR